MDKTNVLLSFAALAQPTRLDVFRLLIKAGEQGLMAGQISSKLKIRQNTMSAHLTILARTKLVRNKREGRSIRYFAHYQGVRALLEFLLQDCCGGNEEICAPLLETLTCGPQN